ncbi:hypothetical protein [Kitasatospora sp. NPDC057223]|uniref:hypothetical protein n=1 Tax=Kitasatospora sp. NPDC057223 TaxID=3346055 RepID=UPI00363151B8
MKIPDQGICAVCEVTVRLRRDGRTFRHSRPYDPDGPIYATDTCPGAEQHPAVRLEMMFARWLHAHHTRRDARENPVTYLAQYVFRACSRTPAKGPAEVTWSTAEELRLLYLRPGVNDWLARYIVQAAAEYDRYDEQRRAVA